jgi:HJR/Mrr/RecB family endonuclease
MSVKNIFGDDEMNFIYWIVFGILVCLVYKLIESNNTLKDKVETLSNFTENDLWLIGERLKYLTPYEFEEICAKLINFLPLGYAYTRPESHDGGVDIVLTSQSKTTFIQCKHWLPTDENKSNVGREVAQRLKGAMDYGFDGSTPVTKGIIITTSDYTEDCKIYCRRMNIEMWNTDDILEIVRMIGTKVVYPLFGINYDGKYITE